MESTRLSDESDIAELIAQIESLVRAAYNRGFQAGGLAMRDTILNAANAPMSIRPGSVTVTASSEVRTAQGAAECSEVGRSRQSERMRAPRGLVAEFLREELGRKPGQTIVELEEAASIMDGRIARKTIGNQLRRFEGEQYRREGYRWFLKQVPDVDLTSDTYG